MLLHYSHKMVPFLSKKELVNALFELRSTIEYVNSNYLAKPYAKEYEAIFPKASKLVKGKNVVYRPNHGLTHTLRSAHLIPQVALYYATFARDAYRFQFKQDDIKKMQVAMLFFVVGRQNEMGFFDNPELYYQFRRASSEAFLDYCHKHMMSLFKTEHELKRYADIIFDYSKRSTSDPVALMIKQAHSLDLLRCFSQAEFDEKCRKSLVEDFTHFARSNPGKVAAWQFANAKVDELIEYAADLIQATGNRISSGMYKKSCNFKQFEKCSKDINHCLKVLSRVKAPGMVEKRSMGMKY